jgi:glycosyltransferase involved in cell wall biosynthesis
VPRLAFVVPVRDRAALLACCLAAIDRAIARAGVGSDVERIVVDNGSRDESADVARRAGARTVVMSGATIGALRNHGVSLTTAQVVAFVDSDVEIGGGWAEAALEILRRPAVVAAGCPTSPPDDATWVARTLEGRRFGPRRPRAVRWLGTGSLAVRRDAFLAAGGFDPSLRACEDIDLCRRLRAAPGANIWLDPRLGSVHHGEPRRLRDLFSSELRRGRDNLTVSLRALPDTGELPSLLLSLATATLIAGLLVSLPWAARGEPRPALVAAMLLVALVALRATQLGWRGWRHLPGTIAVAATYEAARALALLRPRRARAR